MANVSKKTIQNVIEGVGSELVFIVYPHTIALMNWSTLWAILFFFMVITLGIDSTVSSVFEREREKSTFADEIASSVAWNRSSPVCAMNFRMYSAVIVHCSCWECWLSLIWEHCPRAPTVVITSSIWWMKSPLLLLSYWSSSSSASLSRGVTVSIDSPVTSRQWSEQNHRCSGESSGTSSVQCFYW